MNALVKMAGTNTNKINLIPNYDDLAMAHIILSLKLIYGLDGRTEWWVNIIKSNKMFKL